VVTEKKKLRTVPKKGNTKDRGGEVVTAFKLGGGDSRVIMILVFKLTGPTAHCRGEGGK